MTAKALEFADSTGETHLKYIMTMNGYVGFIHIEFGIRYPHPKGLGTVIGKPFATLIFFIKFPNWFSKDRILQGGALCSWALMRAVQLMDSNDIILGPNEASEIDSLLKQHLLHWQGLHQHYLHLGVERWKLRPKHHDTEHLASKTKETRVNPRFTACWQDESYLGQVKQVAVRCHAQNALLRIFQRIILNLSLRWKDVREHASAQQRLSWEKMPWQQLDRAPQPKSWKDICDVFLICFFL